MLHLPRHVQREFTKCLKEGIDGCIDTNDLTTEQWIEVVRIVGHPLKMYDVALAGR
jgi:hypothetical protein